MLWTLLWERRALKELGALETGIAQRIASAVDALTENPTPPGSTKLVGHDFRWRIRVGDYRVIYQVNEAAIQICVVRVGHRREIYDR